MTDSKEKIHKMTTLSTSYNPDLTEKKWYYFWERKGFFHADPLSGKPPYSIMLPPPNITGILHMGHAFVNTQQDVLIRWKRMLGYEVLWMPGTDHAGISTQTIVEKYLIEKTGKGRHDYSREEFIHHVWNWKERHEGQIIDQMKRLGCSCDWRRHRFTMDKRANLAVRTLFKKLYDEGLIYRGDYLVNWDPITQTALADDEVEYVEERTKLWYFRYPLVEEKGYLTIATTRPETMLGDVAVAVSPEDPRYKAYVGKHVTIPIVYRTIPIITDSYVDPNFGTGVVKITPAHDPNDWALAQRHSLPLINILNSNGTINKKGLKYEGLTIKNARLQIVKQIKKMGLLEREEPYTHRIGISYRSKATIEPYLSKQWFIKMGPFKQKLIDAVQEKRVTLFPKTWEHTYFHWINNLRDWCVSRQLWWGHRIPIWHHSSGKTLCYAGEGIPPEVKKDPAGWRQDPDVLDTWFSSSLWPFSTLGWPHQTNELKKFYPNSALVTGHDILFFWVARMIMMGEYAMGKPPFAEVSLQGLIYGKSFFRKNNDGSITYIASQKDHSQDVCAKWEKMSKSKGNVINPIEVIHSHGADAIRMALSASASQNPQIDLDPRCFKEYKNFINKIWNASRFVLMHLTLSSKKFMESLAIFSLEDQWILSLLNRTIQEVHSHLEGYHFDRAASCSYKFFWNHFCAYYVELSKPILIKGGEAGENKQKLLTIVLLAFIRLIHPIMPFITEEIFHLLKERLPHLKPVTSDPYTQEAIHALLTPACMLSPYPKILCEKGINPHVEELFAPLHKVIYTIRNIRAEMQVAPNVATDVFILGETASIAKHQHIIISLVPIKTLHLNAKTLPKEGNSSAIIDDVKIVIPFPKELQKKEKHRLQKEQEKIKKQILSFKNKLSNPNFVTRAPKDLVAQTEDALKRATEISQNISKQLIKLSQL